MENNTELFEENGKVNISDEVIAVVASLAATSVDGIAEMASGVAGSFAELLGMKNITRGVKISKDENTVTVYLAVVVEYGCKIPDVTWEVQTKVKNEVESMTGLDVAAVNIEVDGIVVKTPEKTEEPSDSTEPAENVEVTESVTEPEASIEEAIGDAE